MGQQTATLQQSSAAAQRLPAGGAADAGEVTPILVSLCLTHPGCCPSTNLDADPLSC